MKPGAFIKESYARVNWIQLYKPPRTVFSLHKANFFTFRNFASVADGSCGDGHLRRRRHHRELLIRAKVLTLSYLRPEAQACVQTVHFISQEQTKESGGKKSKVRNPEEKSPLAGHLVRLWRVPNSFHRRHFSLLFALNSEPLKSTVHLHAKLVRYPVTRRVHVLRVLRACLRNLTPPAHLCNLCVVVSAGAKKKQKKPKPKKRWGAPWLRSWRCPRASRS